MNNTGYIVHVMDILYPLMNNLSTFLLAREFDTRVYLTPVVNELVTQSFECLDVDIRTMWLYMKNYPRCDLLPAFNKLPLEGPDHRWLVEVFNGLTMDLWLRMREHGLLMVDYPMRLETVMPDYLIVRL